MKQIQKFMIASLVLAVTLASAQTWTLTTPLDNVADYANQSVLLQSIAMSADGSRLAVSIYEPANWMVPFFSPLYTSTNYGMTWAARFSGDEVSNPFMYGWNAIASSADGQAVALATSDGIHTSTNAGLDWNPTSTASSSFGPIASSGDGTVLAAVGADSIFVSTNSVPLGRQAPTRLFGHPLRFPPTAKGWRRLQFRGQMQFMFPPISVFRGPPAFAHHGFGNPSLLRRMGNG